MIRDLYIWLSLAFFTLVSIWAHPTFAVNPDEILADTILETRAREISKGLRCLVCQNQSIDDSDADLAKDLRLLVRERLSAGDSNESVIQFVVSRYGNFVLMRPPFEISTLALWLGPLIIIFGGLITVGMFFNRRFETGIQNQQSKPLSENEKNRLNEILKGDNL
jgi:cytochrome c-type biogenesis protein CcmH